MRTSDWSSDVCSSDLLVTRQFGGDAITIGHSFGNELSLSTTDKTTVTQMEPAQVHTFCDSRRVTPNNRRTDPEKRIEDLVCENFGSHLLQGADDCTDKVLQIVENIKRG